jgi:hypothetical protein
MPTTSSQVKALTPSSMYIFTFSTHSLIEQAVIFNTLGLSAMKIDFNFFRPGMTDGLA